MSRIQQVRCVTISDLYVVYHAHALEIVPKLIYAEVKLCTPSFPFPFPFSLFCQTYLFQHLL